jgi:restriction system protein
MHRGNPVAIPDFQTVMLPLVEALSDGQERTTRELTDLLAERFKLTVQERQEVLPSGQQSIFSNRVTRAKTHLKNAGPASGRSVRSVGVTTRRSFYGALWPPAY